MKQSKVSTPLPPVRPSTPRGPRYRYFTTLPSVVTLRLRDLQIPEAARTPGYDSEQFVDLPCADIFAGAQPKIRLGRLAELAPEAVTGTSQPEQFVRVCSARLALAYAVTEGREKLEEPPEPVKPPAPPAEEKPAPEPAKDAAKKDTPEGKSPELTPKDPAPAAEKPAEPAKPAPTTIPPKGRFWQRLRAEKLAGEPVTPPTPPPAEAKKDAEKPVEGTPAADTKPAAETKVPAETKITDLPPPPKAETKVPAEEKKPAEKPLDPPAAPKAEAPIKPTDLPPPPKADAPADPANRKVDEPKAEEPKAEAPKPAEPTEEPAAARKPFSLFPLFRRKEPADVKPPVALPPPPTPPATRGRIEIPQPKRRTMSITLPPRDAEAAAAKAEGPPPENKPSVPPPSIVPVPPVAAKAPAAPEATIPIPPPPVLKTEPAESPKAEPPKAPEPPKAEPPKAEAAKPEPPKAEPQTPPPAPPAATQPELPRVAPDPVAAKPAEPAPKPTAPEPAPPAAKPEPVSDAVKESPKEPGKAIEAVLEPTAMLVETEHLPKAKSDLPEQDALQAIFLTEEFLSVDRVVELCGGLPGIKSCVLAHGATVIASHNTPDSVDIVSLSAHALEMLKAMRGSAAKMGIGAVPAVTVHSEKGPITFFHQDDLCLLVLHKDRGFVPGVREKLQSVVNELGRAQLPVPVGKKALGR